MSVPVTITTTRRPARTAVHTYSVPVVRELPSQPAGWPNDVTW
jgi:hypothetical protein